MNSYAIILKALFKNKLRFDDGKNKKKVVAFSLLIAFAYLLVMAAIMNYALYIMESALPSARCNCSGEPQRWSS